MTVKIHINAATGLFEIEGEAEFVLRVYEDVKAVLKDPTSKVDNQERE
jgi:hypothetical protein